MRKWMIVVGLAAMAACGPSKKEYGAKEAEAAKYKQAMQDESGKAAALETKVKSLEEQNAALQAQASGLEKKYAETSAAKSELETTTAKLQQESGQYAKLNQDLQGKLTIRLNDRLLFKENSSALSPESKRTLDTMADAIKQLQDKHVIVVGYTDDAEAAGKNAQVRRWQLSTTRALEVAKYLVGRGIDPTIVGVAGFGQGRPIASNDSLANRGLNRRVEIALTPADYRMGTVDVKPATLNK